MIPSNTNTTAPCTPISSNCVIWQGPDIPCIDLCNGDTVSDVIAALATKLCEIIDEACTCNPDLTGLDLLCTLPDAGVPADLVGTLQAIIDYVCSIVVDPVIDITIPLPKCLQYPDDTIEGGLVTSLPLAEWANLISNRICVIINSIQVLNQNVLNLESRVTILEACVLPCNPSSAVELRVVSSCIFKGQEVTISTLLLALEQEFCRLSASVGTTAQVNGAISAQGLSAADRRLAVAGTIGDITGWIASPKSLAESNTNQWKVIDDLYSAVADIQENCCDTGCSGVSFAFTYNTIDGSGNGVIDQINLNFQATTLPAGFTDCGGSTTVTVTDSNGTFVNQSIVVSNLTDSSSGVNIDITSLDRMSSLNLSIPFCATDDISQCGDRQQVIVPLTAPCPTITVIAPTTDIIVQFANQLGSDVSYTITVTSETTGVQFGTTSITNPGTSINHTFPGATAGETYSVVVSVNAGLNSINTCPAQSVTIPGTTCTNIEVTTPSATSPVINNVYLGLYDNGPTITRYWYDYDLAIIRAENVGATVPCDSPILTSPVMDYLGTPGDVAVDVSYGTEPSPTDFQISWSIDDITYSGLTSYAGAPVNPVVIATGTTSGSVYIKVETTCTGPVQSVPSIIRYDFATGVWTTIQSPQECQVNSLSAACPAGIEVARQYLECGEFSYNVFGGSADSYWFYVGKRVDGLGITRYIYAGWDNLTQSARSVIECCICPTFILSDPIQVLCGHDGDSVTVTIPYVLGAGEPDMAVLTNPVLGSVVQGAITNEFVYTAINPNGATDYADTFQVQLQPTIPGTGECSLATVTIQVQYINCKTKLSYSDQDLYVFINTNGYTAPADGGLIQQGINLLTAQWTIDFGFSGNVYFIPTDSKRWLGYFKSIVDDGASWVPAVNPTWLGYTSLPTSWPGGSGVGVYKNSAMVIIFSQDSSTDYHDNALVSGYGSGLTAQPTTFYKADYDALTDMLTGTQTSVWAAALGITENQFPDGLSSVLYPFVVNGSGGRDAANILQMISAYTAELIPPSKYGIATSVDVTSYILQGVAGTMPYTGATTPSNTITQLFDNNDLGMLALLDQEYSTQVLTEIKDGVNTQFNSTLTRAIKSCGDAYPAGTIPALSVFEVQDCAGVWAPWFVTITDHACGTIGEGTVVKLTNPGATFPAGGGRPEWATGTDKCVTIVDNCSATPLELATDLDSTYDVCASCTP